jgi:putative aldouronate transport system substrate-binding protein
MKKCNNWICIILAVIIMLTIVGCSKTDTSTGQDGGKSETPVTQGDESKTDESDNNDNSETDDIMTPRGKYPEVIELHTVKVADPSSVLPDGDNSENNIMTRYVFDKLNVKIFVDWEVESSEYANKLSLSIASNDLPDMFTIGPSDYLIYRQLRDNDMLADLTEAYEKCAGDYMKDVFGSFDFRNLEPFTEDGRLYGIAGGRYGYEHNLLWLRKDWLDEYGLELPKTVDDIKNILIAFRDKKPVENYVGMLLNATDPAGGYMSAFSATPIFEAFGATPKTWIRDKNGEVVYGSVMPEMKEGLRVLAEWYAEGLIDQQFPTRTDSGANNALWNGGQAGVLFAPWWGPYSWNDLPRNIPEAEIIPVNAPLDSEGNYNVVWPGPSGTGIFVNKNYEHPEAVVKVLNVEYDLWRRFDPDSEEIFKPYEGVNYSWEYLLPTGGVNLEYANIVPDVGLLVKNYIEKGVMEGAATATEGDKNSARSAKEYVDTKDPDKGWAAYYTRYVASNIVNTPEVKIRYPIFSFTTDSMADLKPNLDTLESVALLQIITGEKPVDYFDEFVEQWYAQGGEIVTNEVKSMID